LLLSMAAKSFRNPQHDINSVFRDCQTRIKSLGHLGLAQSGLFDRAEALNQLARESSIELPSPVLDVVGHFVAGRPEEAASAIEPFLALVCEQPREGLRILDQTATFAPNIFLEFGRALDWLFWNGPKKEPLVHSPVAVGRLVHRLFNEVLANEASADARLRLLNYCCAENLSPEKICELLAAQTGGPNALAQQIASDLPLRWTYRAFRLGWAM
jgi:hypothetical protein